MTPDPRSPVGVRFTETMRGHFSTQVVGDGEGTYEQAEGLGRADDSPLEMTVTVTADDVERLVADPEHAARLEGTVTARALATGPLEVRDGRFLLLVVDPDRFRTRRMVYRLPLVAADGRQFILDGFKLVHDDPGPDIWRDTTTLYVTVRAGGPEGQVLGKGIVRIGLPDFIRQLTTLTPVGASNGARGLTAVARFGRFFAGELFNVYGGPCARANVFNPDAPPRPTRALATDPPEVHPFTAGDGVGLRLTRFRGGAKGPVILSPGFGTSALAFTIDTTEQNLPEFLGKNGYDVWVLDYRASPALPSAATAFTLDDVATRDYPAAVDKVREVTGADTVQVVAHCVGSMTLLMGLAAGAVRNVRSAVCSQLTLHNTSPPLNALKVHMHVATLLRGLGLQTLTTDFSSRSGLLDRAADHALRLYPTRQTCDSPVCRRILFMYGDVYDHEQLNPATHDAIHEMFGVASLTAFEHISRILRAGHAVDARGREAYLPHAGRLRLPIAFIHGENNHLFLPEGSQNTYDWLREQNRQDGSGLYTRHVIPGYAHMDCFIGKDAARDVYPAVLRELERHPAAPPRQGAGAAPAHDGPRALEELFRYPFMAALAERRTRRLARGTSMQAGELSHASGNPPAPLTELEEAVLIVSTGVTGVAAHDGPLTTPGGGSELGTPFLNVAARSASSADNCQATSLFMINDAGIWLLRHPRGRAAVEDLRDLPPRWADWRPDDWLRAARAAKVQVWPRRLEFPREYPYYLGWNKQTSNVPGTTLFLPVVDCTRQYINAVLILLSEPDGRRPLFVDDWSRFRPRGFRERLAWVASKVGLAPRVPYQPIGGLARARGGFVNPDNVVPLGFGGALRTDYEAFFYLQNLVLLGQAMGLGGWVHGSVFAPYVLTRDETKGWFGLGFQFEPPRAVRPEPPPPASQPNPVGIPGKLEGLCPPFVPSMDAAIDRVLEEKYGPGGTYTPEQFARPYRDPARAEQYLSRAAKYSPQAVEYAREICRYVYETYGRFPAHVDAFYTPGIWVQFAHLELEYYRKFYDPAQYTRQEAHEEFWHGH